MAKDGVQDEGELGSHLGLLVRREDIDNAVDRLDGRVGVQRREDHVSRLGDVQRGLDALQIAHLADQHDVRVLAQHAP